jgi:hypothetical protein
VVSDINNEVEGLNDIHEGLRVLRAEIRFIYNIADALEYTGNTIMADKLTGIADRLEGGQGLINTGTSGMVNGALRSAQGATNAMLALALDSCLVSEDQQTVDPDQ